MIGHHRGQKQNLRAGYEAPSLKQTFYLSSLSVMDAIVYVIECITDIIFLIVECGIVCFLCATRIIAVRASSSSPRLPLCQILFLSQPPLLS